LYFIVDESDVIAELNDFEEFFSLFEDFAQIIESCCFIWEKNSITRSTIV
jgi:hypothetical protein